MLEISSNDGRAKSKLTCNVGKFSNIQIGDKGKEIISVDE